MTCAFRRTLTLAAAVMIICFGNPAALSAVARLSAFDGHPAKASLSAV